MGIRIEIELQPGETLLQMLRDAGLIYTLHDTVQFPAPDPQRIGQTEGPAGEASTGPQQTAAEAPKRRGRPPKETAPAAEPVFVVRRYDGKVEGEYADSGQATEVLVGLIREAHDEEALDALGKANNDAMQSWPTERIAEVNEAADAVRTVLKSKTAPAEQVAQATADVRHFALDGSPLREITPDKAGAMNGVNAVAAAEGGQGGPGFQAAAEFLKSIGVTTRLSQMPENDPKLAQVAEWAAKRLGLPLAGALV